MSKGLFRLQFCVEGNTHYVLETGNDDVTETPVAGYVGPIQCSGFTMGSNEINTKLHTFHVISSSSMFIQREGLVSILFMPP